MELSHQAHESLSIALDLATFGLRSSKVPQMQLIARDRESNPLLSESGFLLKTHALRAQLSEAAFGEPFAPEKLFLHVEELPRIRYLLGQDARVLEGYTLADHHLMVMSQYARYFRSFSLPAPVTHGAFAIALNLHDAGKSIPEDKRDQHRHTLEVIESVRDYLPIQDVEWCALRTIIGSDVLGKLIRPAMVEFPDKDVRRHWIGRAKEAPLTLEEIREYRSLTKVDPDKVLSAIDEAVTRIEALAAEAGMSPRDFYRLNKLYFQCDTCGYSNDASSPMGARGMPGLEYMYEVNPLYKVHGLDKLFIADSQSGFLKFAPPVDQIVSNLEKALGC